MADRPADRRPTVGHRPKGRDTTTGRAVRALLAAVLVASLPLAATAEVVVLHNGAVHHGDVARETDDSLHLTTGRGPMVLAKAQIEARGPSLLQVYETLAAAARTPQRHQALGHWCMKQGLYTQAEAQFNRLQQDLREDALKQIETQRETREQTAAATTRRTSEPVATPERVDAIGPQVTADFQTRIRPLLQNSCGNAACHGAGSDQSLRLLRGSRSQQLETLDRLLMHIDRDRPGRSHLLTMARTAHGGGPLGGRPGIDPRLQPDQYERLREWVEQAARARAIGQVRTAPIIDISSGAVRIIGRK